jgi:hypothetical protein
VREAFFILLVIVGLLALTAVRYRKQIAGMIGIARMLREAKNAGGLAQPTKKEQRSAQLVNCSACGIWVPADKAKRDRSGLALCAKCA